VNTIQKKRFLILEEFTILNRRENEIRKRNRHILELKTFTARLFWKYNFNLEM